MQAKDLFLNLLDGISDSDNTRDGPWAVAHHVEKRLLCVDLDDPLVERGS